MTRLAVRSVAAANALLAAAAIMLAGCGRPSASAGVPLAGGDGGGLPRSPPAAEHLDASALQAAAAGAARSGARVFLVARHGHLVLEHYASGSSAEDLIDGGTMAQALSALAAGAAVAEGGLAADTSRFDAVSLATSVSAATTTPYTDYVSQRVWQPINAAAARFADASGAVRADCCLAARAADWLRIGIVLLQSGSFEGNAIVPADWVMRMRQPLVDDPTRGFGVWLPVNGRDPEFASAEAFAARDIHFLRGAGGTRLWLAPSLQLAVLYIAAAGATATDHTELFNQTIRAVQDRAQEHAGQNLLQQLVPGH